MSFLRPLTLVKRSIRLCSHLSNELSTVNTLKDFGSLAKKEQLQSTNAHSLAPAKWHRDMEDDDKEQEHFAKVSDTRRPRIQDYEKKISQLLLQQDLLAALKVLDEEMKDELVHPNGAVFNLLIHACGKMGYARKASELLFRFKSRPDSIVKLNMYADVFNACANGPPETKKECLKISKRLRKSLLKDYQKPLTVPLYCTMIAAFGRSGCIETAYEIVDEMIQKNILVATETYNHLLQACIADKKAGFKLSMAIYRRMLEKKVDPDIYTFNLILRATRDCGIGSGKIVNDLLLDAMTSQEIRRFKGRLQETEKKLLDKSLQSQVDMPEEQNTVMEENLDRKVTLVESNQLIGHFQKEMPNLLTRHPNFDYICGVSNNVITAKDRLQMIGGLEGFVKVVQEDFKVTLNIQSFSLLIQSVSPDEECRLLEFAKEANVDPSFYNQLMRKRVERCDYSGASELMDVMNDQGQSPNIVTFGCLAMTCQTPKAIYQFLGDLKACQISPNLVIMTKLIKNASRMKRPDIVLKLLKTTDRYQLKPDIQLLKTVENFYRNYSQFIISVEKESSVKVRSKWLHQEMSDGQPNWTAFCSFYKKWLRSRNMHMPSHPWDQFTTNRDVGIKLK